MSASYASSNYGRLQVRVHVHVHMFILLSCADFLPMHFSAVHLESLGMLAANQAIGSCLARYATQSTGVLDVSSTHIYVISLHPPKPRRGARRICLLRARVCVAEPGISSAT